MKKIILLISLLIFSATMFGQTLTVHKETIPVTKNIDTATLTKIKVSGLDTVSPLNLAVKVVKQDSVIKAQDNIIIKQKTEVQKLKDSAEIYLWNNLPKEFYFWGMFFVFLGVCLSWSLKALFGMKNDATTSKKWDWNEYFKPANVKKRVASFIASFIAAFFTIRFANDWFGTEATMAYCAALGLTLDYILAWYWNKRKNFAPKNVQNNV